MVPYNAPFHCNWLEVFDAVADLIHTSFLHSNISRVQFSPGFGEIGQMDYSERGIWILGTNTHRVGDNIWFRVNEPVFPNFTQAGATWPPPSRAALADLTNSSSLRLIVASSAHRLMSLCICSETSLWSSVIARSYRRNIPAASSRLCLRPFCRAPSTSRLRGRPVSSESLSTMSRVFVFR